jgi:glycosyltransferase involved in cell wall biosynthesis
MIIKHLDQAKGGAEKILCQVASHFATNGHSVSICSFDRSGFKPYYQIEERIELIGLGEEKADKKTSPLIFVKRIFSLRAFILNYNPQIVISFMHSSMAITSLSLIGTKIPMLGSEHIVREHYRNKPIQYLMLLLSVFLSKKTTVISESIKQSFPEFLRNKLAVVSNPVQLCPFQVYPGRKKNNVLLNIARLDPQKNHMGLIKAMRIVANKFPSIQLQIYGEGPLHEQLLNLINELQLGKNVFLMGTRKNIYETFLMSDFYIFPSHYESFGLSLAEALSAGLPAIGFKGVEGVDGLIKDQFNGLLVKESSNNYHALAVSILELIENKSDYDQFSRNASFTVQEFTEKKIMAKWDHVVTCVAQI